MDMGVLLLSTALKIGFVVAIILTFAPLIIWAERRQSAMMQDRVGPVRADLADLLSSLGLKIPPQAIRSAYDAGMKAFAAVAVLSSVGLFGVLAAGVVFTPNTQPMLESVFVTCALLIGGAIGINLVATLLQLSPETAFLRGGAVVISLLLMAIAVLILLLGAQSSPSFSSFDPEWFRVLPAQLGLLPGGMTRGISLGAGVALLAASLVINLGVAWVLRKAYLGFEGRVAFLGLLHPLADALKFVFKEDFVPPKADKVLFAIAPILVVVTAIGTFAVIPFADVFFPMHVADVLRSSESGALCVWGAVAGGGGYGCIAPALEGPAIPMQVASLNVGILFIFAVAGTGVVGAAVAGYASDNKYSLLGGIRAAGQMVSYEVTLGLTIVPMFMLYNTILLDEMVQWQMQSPIGGFWPRWGVFLHPVAFILFFACSIAETKRIPFDVPEGESELVGGYFTEYSGMKFGMFFMGEFVEVVVLAAVAATLFFGGYDVPFLTEHGLQITWFPEWGSILLPHGAVIALQAGAFCVKLALLIWLQLMIRWTLPRFRYDQIMSLCWKYILPISLVSILLTGVWILLAGA